MRFFQFNGPFFNSKGQPPKLQVVAEKLMKVNTEVLPNIISRNYDATAIEYIGNKVLATYYKDQRN